MRDSDGRVLEGRSEARFACRKLHLDGLAARDVPHGPDESIRLALLTLPREESCPLRLHPPHAAVFANHPPLLNEGLPLARIESACNGLLNARAIIGMGK